MKNTFHLAIAYAKYYKKASFALLLGVILSAALFSGVGSLFESGRRAALEDARMNYGDWHFHVRGDEVWGEVFLKNPQGEGYGIEKIGVETIRKVIEEPYEINFVYADDGYLDMMGRKLKEGHYPQKENEVALDSYTLKNLRAPEELGSRIELDGETFVLCGIFSDMPEKMAMAQENTMQVFVNSTLNYEKNGVFLYVKFNESKKIYPQAEAFVERFGVEAENLKRNNGISPYVGSGKPEAVWEIIRAGFQEFREAGVPYILGRLNETGALTRNGILLALGLFGGFVIYSLFQVSVLKRMSQYSIMQTLGITEGIIFAALLWEMCIIFIVGYPLGVILGNGAAGFVYRRIGKIFISPQSGYHLGGGNQAVEKAVVNLPDAGQFFVNWDIVSLGAVFLWILLLFICWRLIRQMKKWSIHQMIVQDMEKHSRSRKIYSIRHKNMAGVVANKFMFSRKGAFLGILLSLSAGSIIFLGASYITENTKINNELTFKADDGLGSDMQVYIASDQLKDVIPKKHMKKIKKLSGLEAVYPVRYLLGEIQLNNGSFLWTSYYPELAKDKENPPDEALMEKYNGTAVQTGEDDYAIKVNVYGYDDAMLKDLNNYLLEGSIDPDRMRKENSIILKTLMDGQGNYDGINLRPGDFVELKTVKNRNVPQEALRFQGTAAWYQSLNLDISAVVSRPLAKVETYIGENYNGQVDLIMTNDQMERNFDVTDFQTISIRLKQGADAQKLTSKIKAITSTVDKCIVKDYTLQIQAQNLYLSQKMLFFYGIAFLLFGISLFHIMNSMQYLISSRRHEFGIMRAMGITDLGFYKMLAKEGFSYGMYSSLAILLIYYFLQKFLHYYMVHVYLYLHPQASISWVPVAGVLILNLMVCMAAVTVSGRMILKQQIVDAIRE